jgi:ABC-type branched-subunit amino acid transport system substrate-binding protein
MKMKGIWGIMIIAALLVLFLKPVFAEEAYVVGSSMAVTGRGSETLAPVKESLDIYFAEINARGGINGHPVKLIFKDNANQPTKAAAQAKQLVTQNKVILLLNSGLSSTYAPMVQVARRYKVPLYYAGAVCPRDVYPPEPDPYQFCSTGFGSKMDSRFALSVIKDISPSNVKLGLVAMNVPVSVTEINFADELSKTISGIDTVDKQYIPPPTADFTPFATKLKDAGANWVFSWAPWSTQVKTFEALRKIGWKGKYIAYAHINSEDELKRIKDDDFIVFGTNAYFSDNTEIHKDILKAIDNKKTIYPYTQLTEGWITAMVLEEILKKTPWPATPKKVIEAMNQVKVEMKGVRGGPLVWSKDNHFRTVNYYRAFAWDSKKNGIRIVKDWTGLEVQ